MPATQPPAESCILGNAGCICFDSRISKVPVGTTQVSCSNKEVAQAMDKALIVQGAAGGVCYIRPYARCLNYVATNPNDDNAQQEWIFRNCYGPPKK